jgi:hypothetical protein
LREGHSVKWNDGLLSDSLEAVKMSIGYVDKRVTGRLGNFDTTRESDTNTTRIYRVWV